MSDIAKACKEIIAVCEKHAELESSNFCDSIKRAMQAAKERLVTEEWSTEYGLCVPVNTDLTGNYARLNDHEAFSLYNDANGDKKRGAGKYLGCPDGEQPDDGWYYVISFPTGAFIFGDDYDCQQQIFNDLFAELRSYDPDCADSINQTLLWKVERASGIRGDFAGIMKKYRERNMADLNGRKAARLRRELAELESAIGPVS